MRPAATRWDGARAATIRGPGRTRGDAPPGRSGGVTIGVNLKLHLDIPATLAWCERAVRLVRGRPQVAAGRVRLWVMPPVPATALVADLLRHSPIALGAQDVSAVDRGAATGGISAADLAWLGCTYVAIGHAERAGVFGEDEVTAAAKVAAARRHGLTPVVCVGEPDRVPADRAAVECLRQLGAILSAGPGAPDAGAPEAGGGAPDAGGGAPEAGAPDAGGPEAGAGVREGRPIVIAYEPHWAIGAAEPADPAHVAAVCDRLREHAATDPAVRGGLVIYGGSAGPGLLTRIGRHVDGLFLGRFAHDPAALAAVLAEAERLVAG